MTRCPSFARAALVLATPVLVLSAPAAFAQPPLEAMHAEYVNGGVTKEEADYLRVRAPSYPLEVLFSKATRAGNAFAADVNVTIRDERGADVLSVQSAEPILLANLPPGRYHVEATYEGRTRTAEVTLGGGHQKLGFSW